MKYIDNQKDIHLSEHAGSDIRRRLRARKGEVDYALEMLFESLRSHGKRIYGSTVSLLGFPFKLHIGAKNGTAYTLYTMLVNIGARVRVIDTDSMHVRKNVELKHSLQGSDAVIIAVNHKIFRALRPKEFRELGIHIVIPMTL